MIPGETVLSQGDAGLKDPHNGPFKVMRSQGNLRYYIGTMFISCGVRDCPECGEYNFGGRVHEKGDELDYNSRETDYFNTHEEAEKALEVYKSAGEMPGRRY
jgi:hypothetical protein